MRRCYKKCYANAKYRAFLTVFSILYYRAAQSYYIKIDAKVTLIIKLCFLTVCIKCGGERTYIVNVGHGCTWVVGRLYNLATISYPLVEGLNTPDELAIPFPKINKRQPHP